MNIDPGSRDAHDDAFDRAMRGRHREALEQVSGTTVARLRSARQAALNHVRPPASGTGWKLAGLAATVFAFAIGLQQLRPPPVATPAVPPPAVTAATTLPDEDVDFVGVLDEHPDLYLWLAANDDVLPPAPEY